MLLTLTASCLRTLLTAPAGETPRLSLDDLPKYTKEVLGLSGLNLTTDLLKGSDRRRLEQIREGADKAGCACLMLIESEPLSLAPGAKGDAAVERMSRVVEAGAALGCNSVGFKAAVTMSGGDAAVERLKLIARAGERADVNVMVSPHAGLTAGHEQLVDLVKKVGGFRIGTFPDFQAAGEQKDPVLYLRRLTPYASVITAATVEFIEGQAAAMPKPKKKPAAPKLDIEELLRAAVGGAKKKGTAAAPPAKVEPLDDEEDDDAELTEEELSELEAGMEPPKEGKPEEPPPEPVLAHKPYDLGPMIEAIVSVGFEGSLAIDYRGGGDPTIGVRRSRAAVQAIVQAASA